MKYAVVLCDGMADYPVEVLGGATPMEKAQKPNMDKLAAGAEVGLVRTVAPGLKPGSDVANLSVMGYDPAIYYTGRSPLEAVSMGVELADTDVALRCNLVTLSDESDYAAKTMIDYCSGDISSQEAAELIAAVQQAFGGGEFDFYPGVSYRHCLVWHGGTTEVGELTPPHDISGRVVGEHLNNSPAAEKLLDMMKRSEAILKDHPVNLARIARGERPATSIWLWGQGKRPTLDSFEQLYGVKGSAVSAVDLIQGIAICAGMNVARVEGATGYIDTCFEAKTQAGIDELKNGQDLVYLHFEAPDECGHRAEVENKVRSIEFIDSRVLVPLLKGLDEIGDDYRILILPDHPTPLCTMTHASDPVPYLLYDSSNIRESGVDCFCENTAKATGNYIEVGHSLMKKFIGR